MNSSKLFLILYFGGCALFLATDVAGSDLPAAPVASPPPFSIRSQRFDPNRNAALDVQQALALAKSSGRKVILDVGGDWCSWCHKMDQFLLTNDAIREALDERFIWLKVNFSDENRNQEFLLKYPKIKGFPHLFVLDANGNLLQSQDASILEDGKGYSQERFWRFINDWSAR